MRSLIILRFPNLFPLLSIRYTMLPAENLWKNKTTKTTLLSKEKTRTQHKNLTDLIWLSKRRVVGKQLVGLRQSWQTVGRCLSMMANSWPIIAESWAINFGKQLGGLQKIGKQLGSNLNLEISHTEQGTLIYICFQHFQKHFGAWCQLKVANDI